MAASDRLCLSALKIRRLERVCHETETRFL